MERPGVEAGAGVRVDAHEVSYLGVVRAHVYQRDRFVAKKI